LLSLGASSSLGPPEDLSTVEELQGRLRRLPLHPNHYSQHLTLYSSGLCRLQRGDPFRLADFSHIAPTPVAA
jgi:hypothetical protein